MKKEKKNTVIIFMLTVWTVIEYVWEKYFKFDTFLEIGQAVKNLVANQGLSSMWRGLGPTVLRDVPFSCKYILFFKVW